MTLGQNNPFGGQPVVHRSRIVEIRVWELRTRVVIQHPADGDESHVDDQHNRETLLDAQPKPVGGLGIERRIRPPALPAGMSPQCSLTVSARALSYKQLMTPADPAMPASAHSTRQSHERLRGAADYRDTAADQPRLRRRKHRN
ncbi:hypothetical protein [Mycobacteroides immunogenum]|uniref:Uncharacterized protein n=1 Tax=Mycobacteroides immunogenum TaxID=83262 RepID=A0ABR5LUE4_9MYCO|nr:hypothetical protein [Mycobacteroides immunogenum]ANO03074.1 hypothetical protein BAB75_06390 [Mycobacteroides immunogenum]KIU38366.1 hypothetical protein TL11_22435 [Mycobacteroides immunogenum]KPG05537.1 hypothetical protein AN909_21340 [Mycobacteroides immunogenum]KPG16812.1 hypothetical protein AN910_00910 [Mycobacteroides immunogenum]KPG29898.1 hypothetical protein AN913_09910 [Mycobacteroides immunogenum]